MEYDKYHSLVNVVDKNINIAFVHRELLLINGLHIFWNITHIFYPFPHF